MISQQLEKQLREIAEGPAEAAAEKLKALLDEQGSTAGGKWEDSIHVRISLAASPRFSNAFRRGTPIISRRLSATASAQSRLSRKDVRYELPRDEAYYTIKEVSELFHVTPQAVHKWIDAGKIEYVSPEQGRRKGYLIPKAQFKPKTNQIEAFLERRTTLFGKDRLELENSTEVFRDGEHD
ncbi:helix-turn-helix domain-containing protein [Saccharibacillus brassicae]|uniref:Helix-turn-helix domain-containing protein n=1 Tax=Saccharibacillus brassicae TaxID=2583377 RepID=A0A4Y6UT66_SACBS|nr:helix-turn-helix domain-containing protein [Saccharibacillus brassicae]QDH20903.1 helix-turn-helix domain-containing protein [Saccharibacillus brassicae]